MHTAERADAVLFVLTKSDRKPDPIERRLVLAVARERLAKATGREPADIVLCTVSATSTERGRNAVCPTIRCPGRTARHSQWLECNSLAAPN